MNLSSPTPTHRGVATSKEAAAHAALWDNSLGARILVLLSRGPLTADEIAGKINVDILNVKPRLSGLKAIGMIESSGTSRPSANAKPSIAWRVVPHMLPPELQSLNQATFTFGG